MSETMERAEITRANVDELLNAGKLEIEMRSGRWWRLRRNGKTRELPRAKKLIIPFKAGLKTTGQIREWDFGENGRLVATHFRVKAGE